MTRQWNYVASMAGALTGLYVIGCIGALWLGKVDFLGFTTAALPVITAWGGYLAALLPKQGDQ